MAKDVAGYNKKDITKSTNKRSNDQKVDYDRLLTSAGEFGWYQVLFTLATFPFFIFCGFSYFSQMFMTEASPNHWCWIPELENLTASERRSLAIPNDDTSRIGYSQCTSYVANWSEVLAKGERPDSTWITEACEYGWEFNKSEIPYPTITSELGWVCERSSYQASAQSAYFVGSLVGGLFFGRLADSYGRIPAIMYSNLVGVVAGVATVFATNFITFTACRFLMGLTYDNCMMMAYILLLEYVAPKYRTFIANAPMAVFYTIGVVTLPWISLACGHWKTISLATSLPMALAILTPFVLPESPRWLLSKRRVDDTIEKVLTIARINKKEIPSKLIEEFRTNENGEHQEKGSIIELLKRPLLRTMFICSCIIYTCNMIIFDATVRSLGALNFSFFVSFSLVSLTEFPASLINSFILDWTGRKRMCVINLILSGTMSILTVFVGAGWPSLLCAVLSRFALNMSLMASMQWSVELLPTPVRGTGNSIVHTCGNIGTIVSPFIAYLSVWTFWLPMFIIGATAYVGAAISLKLPETARKDLPQTFEDAEQLFTGDCVLEFLSKKKVTMAKGHINESYDITEI